MKTRVISGIVAAIIGAGALALMFTPVFPIFVAVLSAVATFEIMNVAQIKSKLIMTPAIILSAIMPNYFAYRSMLPFQIPEDAVLAFSMYPTSLDELMAIADAGEIMPPKSTWFEPKLRSGLFIHEFEE